MIVPSMFIFLMYFESRDWRLLEMSLFSGPRRVDIISCDRGLPPPSEKNEKSWKRKRQHKTTRQK